MRKNVFILCGALLLLFLLTNLALGVADPRDIKRGDPWSECKSGQSDTIYNNIKKSEQVKITTAEILIIPVFPNIRVTIISFKALKPEIKPTKSPCQMRQNNSSMFNFRKK